MKKQDIGLAYEISTIDLSKKEPNFLKATLYVFGIAWIIWVLLVLASTWIGLFSLNV